MLCILHHSMDDFFFVAEFLEVVKTAPPVEEELLTD